MAVWGWSLVVSWQDVHGGVYFLHITLYVAVWHIQRAMSPLFVGAPSLVSLNTLGVGFFGPLSQV